MTAPRITMPDGKPGEGTVFFAYRAKMHTGSSMHAAGAITEEQHRAIALILQGKTAIYEGGQCTPHELEAALNAVGLWQQNDRPSAGSDS